MKNLSEIPPDIATEATAFFHTEESFRLSFETARKVFTPQEQEGLFQELAQRGTTEAAALAFIIRAGCYVDYPAGCKYMLEHCREATAAPDMVEALKDITAAIDAALKLPKLRDVLEAVPLAGGGWVDAEGNPMPFKLAATYPAPDIPPQPMNLPELIELLREQLHRVEIERRRGPKVKKHRRRMVRDMARQWEQITKEAPTISDGCGFLYAMGIIWEATARAARAHIEGRKKNHGWKLPAGVDLSAMKPGAEDLRNELRAILREGK
jgi:hypothetical protein